MKRENTREWTPRIPKSKIITAISPDESVAFITDKQWYHYAQEHFTRRYKKVARYGSSDAISASVSLANKWAGVTFEQRPGEKPKATIGLAKKDRIYTEQGMYKPYATIFQNGSVSYYPRARTAEYLHSKKEIQAIMKQALSTLRKCAPKNE